jgi:hypothetical protein
MSILSPNTLFHFTPSLSNLLGILENTFYPRYCYDEFDLVDNDSQRFIEDAIPMVCFCDIPLSLLMNHINTYGQYGLGMTKEWGLRKGLNPVIYFNKNSHLATKFSELTNSLLWKRTLAGQAVNEIMGYIKPYEGTLYRNGRDVKKNVRFYDEHEWRYVPDISTLNDKGIETFLQRHMYLNQEALREANDKLGMEATRLSFSAEDIKYIIIEDEDQINTMIKRVRAIKSRRYNEDTVDKLASRIITVRQIKEDF